MGEKLKPCPFCGSKSVDLVTDQREDWFWIRCLGCDAKGPSFKTEDEAIEAWSRRSPEVKVEEIEEAAEELEDFAPVVERCGWPCACGFSEDRAQQEACACTGNALKNAADAMREGAQIIRRLTASRLRKAIGGGESEKASRPCDLCGSPPSYGVEVLSVCASCQERAE